MWCCQKLQGSAKREVGAVPALPLCWELWGAPGCQSFSKEENEEGPLIGGGGDEGADSSLPPITQHKSIRWPLWVPTTPPQVWEWSCQMFCWPLDPFSTLLCPALFSVRLTCMNLIMQAPLLAGVGLANGRQPAGDQRQQEKLDSLSLLSPCAGFLVTAPTRECSSRLQLTTGYTAQGWWPLPPSLQPQLPLSGAYSIPEPYPHLRE